MNLARQALSFGAVGMLATLTHVALAWGLIEGAGAVPLVANLLGGCAAFAVSFCGNASVTFRTDRSLWSCARRYALVSLFSLAVTSAILLVVETNGLPTYVYVLVVIVTLPPTTFLLAKLWAFRDERLPMADR